MNGMKQRRDSHALIILLAIVTLLRIPNLFEPYWYGDEGIYLTLGMAVRRGLVLYRDIHDNKPPLLYLVAAVAGSEFWFKFILLGWNLLTIIVFYRLAELLFPKYRCAPIVASSLLALLTLLLEGNIANGEIFMILPVTLGMLFTWHLYSKSTIRSIDSFLLPALVGLSFSAGMLFKVPAAVDFAAALFFIVVGSSTTIREIWKKMWHPTTFVMIAAFLFPLFLSLLYYGVLGGLSPYLKSALLQNVGYLGSWGSGSHGPSTLGHSGLLLRTIALGLAALTIWIMGRRFHLRPSLRLIALWFIFALYGALLSARPYPHYLLEPAVPCALLLTILLFGKQRIGKIMAVMLLSITVFAYMKVGFWQYNTLSYYQNFWNWFTKHESTEQYFAYFGSQVNMTYQVAKYLKMTTNQGDRIFVWGDHPYIYALSGRLPAGRYTVAYHVVDFGGYEETARAIVDQKPTVILTFSDENREFPQLTSELAASYMKTKQIDTATLYRRIAL